MTAGVHPPHRAPSSEDEDTRALLLDSEDIAPEPVQMPGIRNALSRLRDSLRWTDLHRRLAAQPLFAGCSRDEVRWAARSGDEVEVHAGETLLREDTIGHWFVVILAGRVVLTRHGREVATLGPGNHVGEIAILGFGPQPATALATTDCRLFLMGRRSFLSLAHILPSVQRGLFPGIDRSDFVARVRQLRTEGNEAWRRLPAPVRTRAGRGKASVSWVAAPRPGRPVSEQGSFARLASRALRRDEPTGATSTPRTLPLRTVVIPAASMFVVVSLAFAFLWHPPVVVVSPSRAIDVSEDLSVTGSAVHPINGQYLLIPVDVRRPSLAGLLGGMLRDRRTVSLRDGGPDDDTARRLGRLAFADARAHALAAAAAAAGVDPARVEVGWRHRDLQGPSAALVYALALVDLLHPEDLARGRTIAATGALDDDGNVLNVGFLPEKVSSARSGRAVLFLVPPGQDPGAEQTAVHEVASLQEAIEVLRAA